MVPDVVPTIEHKEQKAEPESDLEQKEKLSLKRQKSILKNQKTSKESSRTESQESASKHTSAETATS